MSRCPRAGKMVERPDYARGAHVEAGVAILGTVILWMRWPKAHRIQLSVRVVDDLVDCRLNLGRVPSSGIQRNMPRRFDHTFTSSQGQRPHPASMGPDTTDKVKFYPPAQRLPTARSRTGGHHAPWPAY